MSASLLTPPPTSARCTQCLVTPPSPPSPSTTGTDTTPTSTTASPINQPPTPATPTGMHEPYDADIDDASGSSSPPKQLTQPITFPVSNIRLTRSMAAKMQSKTTSVDAQAPSITCVKLKDTPKANVMPKVNSRYMPKPSVRPKKVRISSSRIPGAGLGLYLLENAKQGEFIARYSGEAIDRMENAARSGHYRIQISKNLFLDAEKSHHFEGRYINDGKRAGCGANARFAAGYRTNICSVTGHEWIRIFATRDIRAGEEIYLDYGSDFWKNISADRPVVQSHSPVQTSLHLSSRAPPKSIHPTKKTTTNTPSPIRRVPKSQLQRTPPFSGILFLQPPSPWTPTTSPPRILGHHNIYTHQTTKHQHSPTHPLNDSLILNDPPYSNTLIMNDTLTILNDVTYTLNDTL